jgi:hypothetical protein
MPTREELILQFMLALVSSVKASDKWHDFDIIALDAARFADAYLDYVNCKQ